MLRSIAQCWRTTAHLKRGFPATEQTALLEHILNDANLQDAAKPRLGELHSLLKSDLGVPLPLHISLSRPITMAAEQLQPFRDALEYRIREACILP